MPQLFENTIIQILEDNTAVETLSFDEEKAEVTAYSKAEKSSKDSIMLKPLKRGYDVIYHGNNNGWQRYEILNEQKHEIDKQIEDLEDTVKGYRKATALQKGRKQSFTEWLADN